MNELVECSREAREKLAAALTMLQMPEAGSLIDSVAGPVARAMGALHQIESSQGAALEAEAPIALACVREALAALQSVPPSRTGDDATAHIAGSLGLVHSLAEKAKTAGTEDTQRSSDLPPVPALDRTQLSGQSSPAPPAGALQASAPPAIEDAPEAPAPAFSSTQMSADSAGGDDEKASAARHNSKRAAAPTETKPKGALEVEANLGAHSATNFYKGLSGNDVIDDGGLFIATYDIPPLGQELWLAVHMPGGYEFNAVAIVRWSRGSEVGDAPPGYGCTFRSVSKEARQLVYRYARNREPLFHDDL